MPTPFPARIPNKFHKTITFDGAAGNGLVGTVAIGTVTGSVLLLYGGVRCTTLLTSSGGTLKLGTVTNTDGLIPQTLASDIDADEFWQDASPEFKVSPAITFQLVGGNIILTVATADVTAGVLEFDFYWLPLSNTGSLA